MSYIICKPEVPVEPLKNEDYEINFRCKGDRFFDLGQSFGRFFVEFVYADTKEPIQFGEQLYLNDKFQESLWKEVRMSDYTNNVFVKSSTHSIVQSIVRDIVEPDENLIGGLVSNSHCIVRQNNSGYAVTGVYSIVDDVNPINEIRPTSSEHSLQSIIGYNLDDLHNHQYCTWGETLTPFPLVGAPASTGLPIPLQDDFSIVTMRNKAGFSRYKRQFMFGNATQSDQNKAINKVPYIYKPTWCDMWDGSKQYWTKDLGIWLTRANILNSIQFPSQLYSAPNTPRGLSSRGVEIRISDFEFLMYTVGDSAPVYKTPRQYIWTTDIRTHSIDSTFYNNKNILEGSYEFAVVGFVDAKSINNKNPEGCPYKSGFNMGLINNQDQKPPFVPVSLQWIIDHGDEIVNIPNNERIRLFDRKEVNLNGTPYVETRIDAITSYIEFLRCVGINPFNSSGKRAKMDFNTFVSQLLWLPVSMRKDRKYKDGETVNPVTRLGIDMDVFDPDNTFVPHAYQLCVVGFKRIRV